MSKKFKYLFLIISIFLIALAQTYSLWLPVDEKVDESELVYFAVGFFGGDLDPHWYGYGNLGMYILSFMYTITYPIYTFFHINIESFDDYAILLFSSDYFIDYGRLIYSIFGVLTAFLYLYMINKLTKNIFYTVLFGLVYLTSYESIYFSNYIRIDQLVSLLIAIILYLTIYINRKYYYLVSIAIGAVIAVKISTLALGILYIYATYLLYKKNKIRIYDIVFTSFLLIISIQLFQPYNDLLAFINNVANNNTVESVPFFLKLNKLYTTLLMNIKHNINMYLLYCLVLLPFAMKYYMRIVSISIFVFMLLLLPYIMGNGVVRNYWLIANYDLLYFLIALSIFSVFRFFNSFMRIKYYFFSIIILFFSLLIYENLVQYIKITNVYCKKSNKQLAKEWVEKNLVKDKNVTILLDMHKNYNVPKIYNKNDIELSKVVTRDFIYNRRYNTYLNNIFARYIQNYYIEKITLNDKYIKLLRIDPLNFPMKNVEISNMIIEYNNINIPFKIIRTKDIENLKYINKKIVFDSIGKDPYLVIKPLKRIKSNNNLKISFITKNTNKSDIMIYSDIGSGFSRKYSKKILYNKQNIEFFFTSIVSIDNKKYAAVLPIRATLIDEYFIDKYKGKYFITSPSIYKQFINKKSYKEGHMTRKTPEIFDNYYRFMISNKLIKKFDKGYGSVIEIYYIGSKINEK